MPTNRPRKPKAHQKVCAEFEVKSHRWERLPSAKELGITRAQHVALIRIRRLYGDVEDTLSYLTLDECLPKIQEAEGLIRKHFASDWEKINARATPGVAVERLALAT